MVSSSREASSSVFDRYETVIGLETHVQLNTVSKLFSPAPNRYGDAPNTNVDVVDAGLPGVLPVPNAAAIWCAVKLGLAVGATIRTTSVFARKHYFYPDLPKGYQISQYELPICEGGHVVIETREGPKNIPLTRIHIEEDAGKSIHQEGTFGSSLDYNRAGTPLLEVVSEPAMRTAEEAMAYMRALRQLVMALGICDGNLQEGSMRADANVSVRRVGSTTLGTRTELKNLNSPRFLGDAVVYEAKRHVTELEQGRVIVQETRLWDPDTRVSRSMRGKEEAHDYRYFPDPDLLPVVVDAALLQRARSEQPELPHEKRARYVNVLGLSAYDARVLTDEMALAAWFERALAVHTNPKAVANWVMNDVARVRKQLALRARTDARETQARDDDDEIEDDASPDDEKSTALAIGEESAPALASLEALPFTPEALAHLVKRIDDGTVSGKSAKDVFQRLAAGEHADPDAIIAAHGLALEKDDGKLASLVDDAIAAHPSEVEKYRAGKTQILGFFVGKVLKASGGKADPAVVSQLVKARIDG
jgi:aspartyl-tRNA(Asn)/glutamyl-tRNA(Gln) amidotransferase subunit B